MLLRKEDKREKQGRLGIIRKRRKEGESEYTEKSKAKNIESKEYRKVIKNSMGDKREKQGRKNLLPSSDSLTLNIYNLIMTFTNLIMPFKLPSKCLVKG